MVLMVVVSFVDAITGDYCTHHILGLSLTVLCGFNYKKRQNRDWGVTVSVGPMH